MEHDAVRFMKRLHEVPAFAPEDVLHRPFHRGDDVHDGASRPERRRDFQADETGADDRDVAAGLEGLDQRAGVRERTQIVHVRLVRTGDREFDR